MRSMQWMVFVASVGLLCWPAAAQVEVVFDFEGPTYSPGPLEGQDGWFVVQSDGSANVDGSENGPWLPGSQCLNLSNIPGVIEVQNSFADLIESGGQLVTYQYDYRKVENANDNIHEFLPRIPGGKVGHWADNWDQWTGAYQPDGSDWQYSHGWRWPDNDYVWHTHKWVIVYSDHDGGNGQLLEWSFDGYEETRYPYQQCYIRNDESGVLDQISLFLGEMWYSELWDDNLLVDNIIIRAEPLPSAIPVADAGPDQSYPGNWDGIPVDGSGSSDDGEIVGYRWTTGDRHEALLYDGPEATPTIDLGEGTHLLMLEVFDDTGLRDTDFATYTIGPRPPIDDEVAGPWGIRNADIYGTGASDQIAIDTSSGEFEVLNQVYVSEPWNGLPAEGNGAGNIVIDRFGNIYFLSWNEFLESYDKYLHYRWTGHDEGDPKRLGDSLNNHTVIAGIRYIYAVGGDNADNPDEPKVYAFEKSTGQLVWESAQLTGEDWAGAPARPKVTLYNDKLYIIGDSTQSNDVRIHQVDATSGNLDWSSTCMVELNYDNENNAGGATFVPDAYGEGLHGLFWTQMSDIPEFASFDGYADMAAIMIDPASGATSAWVPPVDGPGLDKSHVIYSSTTGRLYTPSYYGDDGYGWPSSFYAWTPGAGFFGAYSEADGGNHGARDLFVLDFDGTTVHAVGMFDFGTSVGDAIYSYTDNGGGSFSVEYRDHGGWLATGWGFSGQGCLLEDQNGDSILIAATEPYDDPNNSIFVPPKVLALNLSEPADPNGNTPIAEWVAGEWDAGNERWTWNMPYVGPTPGPDGSFYIMQNDYDWYGAQGRITQLRFVPPSGCVGDVDGDGDTDHSDLGALLAAWGSQPGDPNWNPGADLDGNGEVGHSDLGILLADWGCGVP